MILNAFLLERISKDNPQKRQTTIYGSQKSASLQVPSMQRGHSGERDLTPSFDNQGLGGLDLVFPPVQRPPLKDMPIEARTPGSHTHSIGD